jgi:hypothetical protein
MAMVFFREPWYLWRNKHLFSYEVQEFQILESEFQFSDSPDIGIQKIFSDRNLWNQKNELEFCLRWRSQKSEPKIGIPNQAPRTRAAISLGTSGNLMGSQLFLALDTGAIVTRHQWMVLPMPLLVIDWVNFLGWGEPSKTFNIA